MRQVLAALLLALSLAACSGPPLTTTPNDTSIGESAVFTPLGDQLPQVNVQVSDLHGETGTLTAQVVNGKLLYQNDILLGHLPASQADAPAERITALATPIATSQRWPGGVIPYVFRPDVPQTVRNQVKQGIGTYQRLTNVRWVPRTSEVYYVEFIVDSGCYSYVGRSSILRQPQPISLGRGECGVSGAIHEMAHAAGLYHEQSRPDRDRYVRIRWENIPGEWHSQYRTGLKSSAHGTYNYTSIMHYPAYFKGKLAIEPLDSTVRVEALGSARTLTEGDISGLHLLYPVAAR